MPAMMMAGGGALLGVGGGVSKMLGGQDQAKAAREAAKQYIAYQERERQKFLDANGPIRDKLMQYAAGNMGYEADTIRGMKDEVNENYGQGLADMSRIAGSSAVSKNSGGGNVYTPGRYDRAVRTMGQNLAANKASQIRDVNQKNADMEISNRRWAVSALPTYSPGYSATPQIGYDAFQGLNATAPAGNYIGDMLQGLGQPLMGAGMQGVATGAIYDKLIKAQQMNDRRVSDGGMDWNSYHSAMTDYNPGYNYLG